jgi:exopolyphosphatase/guanosine-5'-triphosphate,3'-diphosphate pyrophosphatase
MPETTKTLAAIDVGTNSFHLVVVKLLGNHKFSAIDREKIVVRLGESPTEMKQLTEEAMTRGVEAMKLFAIVAAQTSSPIRAVATSAVREATNGEEFVSRVRKETGIQIEVVSGFEEARLIYLGVLQALPVFNERVALFDIGGGSTEFLVGERGRTLYANSFKIGAIRMTQRAFPSEVITPEQIEQCRLFVRGDIYHAAQQIRSAGATRTIASSGTAQTIAAMSIAMKGEPVPESLNGVTISRNAVRMVSERVLGARSHAERATLPGVDPRRADILAAGCVVLETILEECGFDSYTISSYALREGIVLDSIQKMEDDRSGTAHLSDLRYETVMKIGRMYNFDEAHGRHVADLSLAIYDQLAPLHRLGDDSRELLEAAALLHDVGYYISHSDHHKHSLYLIQNSETFGFNNEELAVIANVARYHRKSHPKGRHPAFAALRKSDQLRVRLLASILRVADGLDRTHKGNVVSVETTCDETSIRFRPLCRPGIAPTFELWSANRKKGLMEEVFAREVVLLFEEEVGESRGREVGESRVEIPEPKEPISDIP